MNKLIPSLLRILIVDDDEVDRLIIKKNLKRLFPQADFFETDSIPAAEQAIAEHQFECIFVDYRLKGGDGLELLRTFRDRGVSTPIIVVTSQGDEKIAVEVMKARASDYIQKDILNTDMLGQVVRNAIRAHDLEEKSKATARKLEDSQARLYEAQRIANIGSWEVDLEHDTHYWSDQIYRILGYLEPDTALPEIESFSKHIHPDYIEDVSAAYRDCVVDGVNIQFDMMMLDARGRTFYAEVHGHAIRNEAGRTLRVVGTLQDITHRKETEQALIAARDEAQQLARAKEEFLANMSHEIRTPMNAIIGYTKLLQNTPLDNIQFEYLTSIDNAGKTLIAIINDILDLSRIESGRLEFEHHSFSLRELLNNLLGMFAVRSGEKSIPISVLVNEEIPDRVCGDPVRLNQILINLVGNALKFTEKGKIDIRVSIYRREEKDIRLKFEVVDTGIGIERSKQASIFESFTQASSDTTRKYGGSGLGLTISKRLVELQNGSIGLMSEKGKGSNFFFEMPFSPCKVVTQGPPVPIATIQTRQPVKVRVLVADDIELNQRLATRILELAGHSFDVAATGTEAVEKVLNGAFDLVLMDIQMPEMDGYQATQVIRKQPAAHLQNLPIIALTAHAMPDQLAKIRSAGFTEVLSKPFQPDQLLAMIQKLCGPPAPESPAVLLDAVEELTAGDDQLKSELIEIFQREVPVSVGKLNAACMNQDMEGVKRTLHALKPSLLLFKVKDSHELIRSLEDACEQENMDKASKIIESLTKVTGQALEVLA